METLLGEQNCRSRPAIITFSFRSCPWTKLLILGGQLYLPTQSQSQVGLVMLLLVLQVNCLS